MTFEGVKNLLMALQKSNRMLKDMLELRDKQYFHACEEIVKLRKVIANYQDRFQE